MGTSNESEMRIGYFTKFGDGACDISPLAGIYKTQVRQIARIINVPEKIIKRKPSAGLWEGQTDEAEIGMTYDVLDPVLFSIMNGLEDEEISKASGIPADTVAAIRARIKNTEHKRMLPLTP